MDSVYGEDGPWGVMVDVGGEDEHWYSWRGYQRPMVKDHACALADTLNRGATSGRCEARAIPPQTYSRT